MLFRRPACPQARDQKLTEVTGMRTVCQRTLRWEDLTFESTQSASFRFSDLLMIPALCDGALHPKLLLAAVQPFFPWTQASERLATKFTRAFTNLFFHDDKRVAPDGGLPCACFCISFIFLQCRFSGSCATRSGEGLKKFLGSHICCLDMYMVFREARGRAGSWSEIVSVRRAKALTWGNVVSHSKGVFDMLI